MKTCANHTTAVPVIVICLACAALVALLSYLSLWIGDDTVYQYIIGTGKPISNIGDIFLSQNIHYMSVNGRYVAHWLVQFMLGIGGRTLFTILNTLVYLSFVVLVARHSGVSLRRWPVALIVACACIVGFQTKFVPSCQIGYMWMFTLVLATLYVFFHDSWQRQWLWLLLPFSFLAGEGQEALNVGVCGALFIYVLQQRARLSYKQWALLAAFFIGAAFLVLAPGSHSRLDGLQNVSVGTSLPISVYVFLTELRLTWLMLILLAVALWSKNTTLKEFYKTNSFEIHVYLICLAMNFYVHIYCNRQMFGMELMALIISLRLLRTIGNHKLEVGVGVLLALAVAYIGVTDYRIATRRAAIYDEIIAQYNASGDGTIFMDISDKDSEIDDFDPCDAFDIIRQKVMADDLQIKGQDINKELLILPNALKKRPKTDCAYRMSPDGRIYVVCFNKKPVVERSLRLFGRRIQLHDYTPGDKRLLFANDNFSIYIIETGNGQSHATKHIIFNDSVKFEPL